MKFLLAAASVIALSAAPAFAGDGQVGQNSLVEMGLGGMKAMSDNDGMQVRGLSVAVAAGHSVAVQVGIGGVAASSNGYIAAGNHSASGSNDSFAAAFIISGRSIIAVGVVAGGSSSAHAR